MKIVHAVYSLEMGGAEVLVSQLCHIQRSQGHDVSVSAYSKAGVIGEALRSQGFEVRVQGEGHPLHSMWKYFRMFRNIKPDVVHCHNVAPTIQAAPGARLAGVPRVISTRHGLEALYNVPYELKYNFGAFFCDWITGICENTCSQLRGAPLANKKKIVCVYNGTSAVKRVSFEGLDKSGFTIVFVGRLAVIKDVGTLIESVALAIDQVLDLRLWVVGDGAVRPQLEKLAHELGLKDHVRFWGQQMDTAPFFSAADTFVMSSLAEGLPMSLLQSMSLGTPAILTDVGGNGEVLRLTGGGLLVPVSNPAEMAKAIVKMATEPELRAECSRRALEGYEQQFTLERMNAAYMGLYQGTVQVRPT